MQPHAALRPATQRVGGDSGLRGFEIEAEIDGGAENALSVDHRILRITGANHREQHHEEDDHHRNAAHYVEPRTEAAVDARAILVEVFVLLALLVVAHDRFPLIAFYAEPRWSSPEPSLTSTQRPTGAEAAQIVAIAIFPAMQQFGLVPGGFCGIRNRDSPALRHTRQICLDSKAAHRLFSDFDLIPTFAKFLA